MNRIKNILRKLSTAKLLCAGLAVAALLAATNMNAQFAPAYQGQFSLPYDVRWCGAVLPAGDYLLQIEHMNGVRLVVIKEAESRKTVAFFASPISEDDRSKDGKTALLIGSRGGQLIVHSLKLADSGRVLIYDRALARERDKTEEARGENVVPVIAAKK